MIKIMKAKLVNLQLALISKEPHCEEKPFKKRKCLHNLFALWAEKKREKWLRQRTLNFLKSSLSLISKGNIL